MQSNQILPFHLHVIKLTMIQ
uniref:Uncharacterized protein n=1 Tax=Rhizophora mucronata TaxID=61149 RepID=A0A2P2ITS8_RHIMU